MPTASSGASSRTRWALAFIIGALAIAVWWWATREAPVAEARPTPVAEAAREAQAEPTTPPAQVNPVVDAGTALIQPEAPAAEAVPTLAEQRLPGGTRIYGSVQESHGGAPVHAGAHCELAAVPVVGVAGDCRVFLECEGYVLHGQPVRHPVKCGADAEGLVNSVSDEHTSARDVDAALRLVAGSSLIEVEDERPGEYGWYTMKIAVESVEAARH